MDYRNTDLGIWLMQGDCLELMDKIPEGKVDLILADPPYGTTANKWDSVIDLENMWNQLKRIIKRNSPTILFGQEPFSSNLRTSNMEQWKYDWVWVKNRPSGFVQAKNRPMSSHEFLHVFSTGVTVHKGQSKNRMPYYPQGLVEVNRTVRNSRSHLEKGATLLSQRENLIKTNMSRNTRGIP